MDGGLTAPARSDDAHDRRHAVLRLFHDRTRHLSDPEEILTTLAQVLHEQLDISHVIYGEGEDADAEDPRIFHAANGVPRNDLFRHIPTAAAYANLVQRWRSGRGLIVNDNREEDRAPGDPLQATADVLGARAAIYVPIVKEGEMVAILAALHPSPRAWTREEIELCEELSERVWATVSRARAEAELRERESNQKFLIDWSDRVRSTTAPDAIMAITLEALGRHLGVTRTTYSEGDAEGRRFTILGEWRDGVIPIGGTSFSLDDVGATVDREWMAGEIVCYHDVTTDARIEPEALPGYVGAEILAFISIPLIQHGKVRSALSVQHKAPRRWRESEIELMREIAERTWVSLGRARAQAELEERERHQAFLLDWSDRLRGETSPELILDITLERLARHLRTARANFAEADRAGRTFTIEREWRRDAQSGGGYGPDREGISDGVHQSYFAGEVVVVSDIYHDARFDEDAQVAYAYVEAVAFLGIPLIRHGVVRAVLSVQQAEPRIWQAAEIQLLRDVADRTWVMLERARAEAALLERERNQAFLIEWSDKVRGETSPEEIMRETLEALYGYLGVTRVSFSEIDPDGVFEVTAEARAPHVSSIRGNRFTLPQVGSAVDREWAAGEVIRYADVAADTRLEASARQRYADAQIAAFVSIPLVQEGRMQSALSVQFDQPRQWRDGEIQLMRDIAERTWVTLERARAQAALQDRQHNQAFLIEWNDSIRNETSARKILATTLRRLGEHLGVMRANYAEATEDGQTLCVLQEWANGAISVVNERYPLAVLGKRLAAAHLSGRPVRIDDIATDLRFDEDNRPLFESLGIGAVLTLPMVRAGEIVAVLSVQSPHPRRWTDGEVELVRDLADRTLAVLERAQSEERLAESEAQLAAFLENAPLVMHLKDAEGRYIRINPEFGRALGRPLEELTGAHPSEIFAPEIAEQIEAIDRRAMAGEVASAEIEVGLGERYSTILSIVFPIPGSTGVAKTAGFAIDLTERKRAEAALARSREALYQTEKLTALGSLLAGVSHELNNPLSIVVAQAVMMERQSRGSELAERAQKIRKAADRCARIVQTFLAMARQKRPERESVDLNHVAMAAHELANYGLKNDAIITVQELAEGLPPISADADQLHQIIINLIVNAQQAMVDAGTSKRVLTLRTGPGEQPGTVMLEVQDSGPGIPEKARRRIFEPFYTTKPQGQGTGVGLSFSQGLAEAHGGRLELVPSEHGACFRLTLPIDPHQTLPAAPVEVITPAPSPARRALVIDDEQEIAESLADFLSIEGFSCEIAVGGAAAKARLKTGAYDLIVSDLRMPDVDGPQLHAWVAAERPDLLDRMAFATGDTLGASAARFLADVKRPVLEKPFMPDAVRRFLQQMDLA